MVLPPHGWDDGSDKASSSILGSRSLLAPCPTNTVSQPTPINLVIQYTSLQNPYIPPSLRSIHHPHQTPAVLNPQSHPQLSTESQHPHRHLLSLQRQISRATRSKASKFHVLPLPFVHLETIGIRSSRTSIGTNQLEHTSQPRGVFPHNHHGQVYPRRHCFTQINV